jgi:hypothetical protein
MYHSPSYHRCRPRRSGSCCGASVTGSALIAWLFHLGVLQAHENLEAEVHEGENVPSGVSQLAGARACPDR